MRLTWLPGGRDDYLFWQQNDLKTLARVNELIRDAMRNPFTGIGKPEPLKANFKGWWSRRITQEHRLVYRCENDMLIIFQCRFHYHQ
ncbi:MAG: Txe/YoeB family addiction module toxin [Chthoniobacterales bacterium]|nr:Txe/YoeB family addiction module toxin [Chthoniobacterales bacterium]